MANTMYSLFYNEKWTEAEERLNNKSLGVGELFFKDVRLICACRERWTHSNLITSIQKDNWTVLHIVGYKNAPLPLVVKLLDKGLDVNAQLKVRSKIRLVLFSRTILHKNWPKFKTFEKDGRTPLYVAAEFNANTKIIELLLDRGADPNKAGIVCLFSRKTDMYNPV